MAEFSQICVLELITAKVAKDNAKHAKDKFRIAADAASSTVLAGIFTTE
jgi:hypothetical protein